MQDIEDAIVLASKGQPENQSLMQRLAMIKRSDVWKPMVLSIFLMGYQQLAGVNGVIFFLSSIFETAGVSDLTVATTSVWIVQCLATVAGACVCDRLGRKIILYASSTFELTALVILGVYYYKKEGNDEFASSFGWLSILCCIIFIIGFSIGWGPLPWGMIPELTPQFARPLTCGVATAFNWFCAFIVTLYFEALQNAIKPYGAFWMFACIVATGYAFNFFALPETKGKTLEEIQDSYVSERERRRRSTLKIQRRSMSMQGSIHGHEKEARYPTNL